MVTESPVEFWRRSVYPVLESIAGETRLLSEFRAGLDNDRAIAGHIENMGRALERFPTGRRAAYEGWCLDRGSYDYGSEAYYQSRLLSLLTFVQSETDRHRLFAEEFCARQTIRPAAFSASPLINRIERRSLSYIIYPASMVAWMYTFFEAVAAIANGREVDTDALRQYLLYVVAARTFKLHETVWTGYALDYVIDSMVNIDGAPAASERLNPSDLGAQLVHACEEFIIAHELGHALLRHTSGDIESESAADRRGLELLLEMPSAAFGWVPKPMIDPAYTPWLGYAAIRMWTNIRLSAEYRAVPLVHDTVEARQRQVKEIDAAFKSRIEQAERLGLASETRVPSDVRAVVQASGELIKRLAEVDLDLGLVGRVKSVAATLGRGDYDTLGGFSVPE